MQLLFFDQWVPDTFFKAISWVLIHSLWQGLLAAALAGVFIHYTRKASAQLRYTVLGSILLFFILAVVVTTWQQLTGRAVELSNPDEGLLTGNILVNQEGTMGSVLEQDWLGTLINWVNDHADWLVLVWAVFFTFYCLKILLGLTAIHTIKRHHTREVEPFLQNRFDKLARQLGIHRSILLTESAAIKVPAAIGFIKPVVLVPLGLLTNLPAEQVETILLHELAHIRRADYGINLLQRFLDAAFFFNPGLRWISALIRQEREACCDDVVIANTANKGGYLEALVSFQEYAISAASPAMALGNSTGDLLNRVRRMLTQENKTLNAMEKLTLFAGLVGLSAFSFMPVKETTPVAEAILGMGTGRMELKQELTPQLKPVTAKAKSRKMPVINSAAQIDTVPVKPGRRKADRFPSISSTVTKEGDTKTETTIATDQDGKKYQIRRLNQELKSLSIDDKKVPEDEINEYLPVLKQVDNNIKAITGERTAPKRATELKWKRKMIDRRNENTRRKIEQQRRVRSAMIERRKQSDRQIRERIEKKERNEKMKKETVKKQRSSFRSADREPENLKQDK